MVRWVTSENRIYLDGGPKGEVGLMMHEYPWPGGTN